MTLSFEQDRRRRAVEAADHSLRLEGLTPSLLAMQLGDEVIAGRMTWDEYRRKICEAN